MLPAGVQAVTGDGLETLVAAPGGGAALARARDSDLYILADPDLIDNFAFASRDTARGAALLLRSEEHTSELQSLMRISYAVFCLKKNKTSKRWLNVITHMAVKLSRIN